MRKCIVNMVLAIFFSCSVLAQNDKDVILPSLEFLNKRFHLNLDKASEPILIFWGNDYYICNKYNHNTKNDLNRFKISYTIEKDSEIKFSFRLELYGETITGSFDVAEDNGNYEFLNFRYISRID